RRRHTRFSRDWSSDVCSSDLPLEDLLRVVDEVHLVHAQDQVRHAQQGAQEGVPAGLLNQTLAGIDQDQREVGGGGAGDHVTGVLDRKSGVEGKGVDGGGGGGV